jgi:hypothetical protein
MIDCIVKYVNGHIEAYRKSDMAFLQSADNERELETDLEQIIEKVMTA